MEIAARLSEHRLASTTREGGRPFFGLAGLTPIQAHLLARRTAFRSYDTKSRYHRTKGFSLLVRHRFDFHVTLIQSIVALCRSLILLLRIGQGRPHRLLVTAAIWFHGR